MERGEKMRASGEKIFHFIFNIVFNNIDIILFSILIFIKLFKYEQSISPEYLYSAVVIPIAASIITLIAISLIFKEKSRVRFLYIMDIVISLLLIVDIMYYRYFKDITTISAVRNAKLLTGVSDSVTSLFNIKDIFYILDVFILIPFQRSYRRIRKNTIKFSYRILCFLILFGVGIGVNARVLYGVSKAQPTLLTAMSNRIYLTKMIGNIDFHIVDAYNFISTDIKNSQKLPDDRVNDIKEYFEKNSKENGQAAVMTGKYKGKNLIVIQVEALQQFVINKEVNGQEITPNLNRWIKKSMYFNNYYYQVAGGTTSDAEFMSNNSLYPAQSGAAYYTYSGDTYDSLGVALKNKGYYTAALHGNTEGFWNRNVMYKAEGFDDFFGQHSYNVNEVIGLGLSDKSFLNQSITKMKKFKQPYYSFVVTLTSHFPYDAADKYGDFNTGKYEGTFIGNYLKAIHYTDEQLGNYLDTLEKDGTLKNSVLAIYGDHFAIPKDKMDQLYNFEGVKNPNDYTWFMYQKVPLIMHFPDNMNSGVVNNDYTCQMDLYPTIANLLDIKNKYMFGKDMFNNNSGKVLFRNGSFIDGKNLYVSWTNSYYDLKTGKTVSETQNLKSEKDEYTKELQYSDDFLNHNLMKDFLNK